eukprot:235704_1
MPMSNKLPSLFSNHSHQSPMCDLVGTGHHTLLLVFGYLRQTAEIITYQKIIPKILKDFGYDIDYTDNDLNETELINSFYKANNMNPSSLPFTYNIIRLIMNYFDNALYWNLNGHLLNELKIIPGNKHSKMINNTFKIKHFTFNFILCPNGIKSQFKGYVIPYIHIQSMPQYIAEIILCYEIYCIQTESHYKTVSKIHNKYQFMTWHPYSLPIEKCQYLKSLDFIVIIDILKVVNKKQSYQYKRFHHRVRESLSPYTPSADYKWVISEDNLSAFKFCPFKMYFCSPNFANNTWFIYAYPRYHEKYPKYIGIYLGLQLLSKPSFVDSLYCDITVIQLNGQKQKKVFIYKRHIHTNTRLDFFICHVNCPLSFVINIKILDLVSKVKNPHYTKNLKYLAASNIWRQ